MDQTRTAHIIQQKSRTSDVIGQESADFDSLLLSSKVLRGLTKSGFHRPSPIQLKAIPLGRCGLDLVVQAKSGTGKTCVFSVIALESILEESSTIQVLVLAPTREIAVQIWQVVTAIGSEMEQLRCYTFIGGLPLTEDRKKLKKCHIAIGTPGRIKQLIEEGSLVTTNIRLFVLDEADKLMEDNFQDVINWIYSSLPDNKQMLALSATYPEVLAQHLTAYMRNPTFVRLNSSDPALLGIRQYYKLVKFHPLPHQAFEEKVKHLFELLSSVAFNQCLVFSNFQLRAQSLSDVLNSKGWPATYISGRQDQEHRLDAMAKLKLFQCRVLISTDLTARGIDAENVNLVVNLDIPRDHETYLHRIGRAGRFGSYGCAVTFASHGKEVEELHKIEELCNTSIQQLPTPIPVDLAKSSGYVNIDNLVTTEQIMTKTNEDASNLNSTTKTDISLSIEKQNDITKLQMNGNHLGDVSDLEKNKDASEEIDFGTHKSDVGKVANVKDLVEDHESNDKAVNQDQQLEFTFSWEHKEESPSASSSNKCGDWGEIIAGHYKKKKNSQTTLESYQDVVIDYRDFTEGESCDVNIPKYKYESTERERTNIFENSEAMDAYMESVYKALSEWDLLGPEEEDKTRHKDKEKANEKQKLENELKGDARMQDKHNGGVHERPKSTKEKNYKNSPRSLGYYIKQCKDTQFSGSELLKEADKVDCPVPVKSFNNGTSQGKSLISKLAVHAEDLTDGASSRSGYFLYADDDESNDDDDDSSSFTSEESYLQGDDYAQDTYQRQNATQFQNMPPDGASNYWGIPPAQPFVFDGHHTSQPRLATDRQSSFAKPKTSPQVDPQNMQNWGQGDFNFLSNPDPYYHYQMFYQQYLIHMQWAQYYKDQCEKMSQDQRIKDTLEAQKNYIHEMSKWYHQTK